MNELTDKQKKIFSYISHCIKTSGIPPSIREIAAHFRYKSHGTVQDHLEALKKKGFIESLASVARGIKLRHQGIPFVGYVQAGTPTAENFDVYSYIDLGMRGDLCALRVKGDSMKDAGILEGDIVVAQKNPSSARSGDIVIAGSGDEVTVKYLRRRRGKYLLAPANKNYKEIEVDEGHTILGKVLFVLRKY